MSEGQDKEQVGNKSDLRKQAFEMLKEQPKPESAIAYISASPPASMQTEGEAEAECDDCNACGSDIDEKDEEKTELVVQQDRVEKYEFKPAMDIGQTRFGITCTGGPIMNDHWLTDNSVCGDQIMALPSSVLVAGRSKQAGGVAVDMLLFLDSIIEGAGKLQGIPGIVEASTLPAWCVARLMGSFPALMSVYNEALKQSELAIEAAAMKAAIGMKVTNSRRLVKDKNGEKEVSEEVLVKELAPDAALSKFILANRMKERYKDDNDVKQAVQINLIGAEADL